MEGPLTGCEVLVTRPRERVGELVSLLEAAGARPSVHPMLEVVGPRDEGALRAAVEAIRSYDWVVFTSAYAVRALTALVTPGEGFPGEGPRVACVGRATATAAEAAGWPVALVPEAATAEALSAALLAGLEEPEGTRVLFPRAEDAREVLTTRLRSAGVEVVDVVAYRKVPVEDQAALARRLAAGEIDVLTFTSPSGARTFVERLGTAAAGQRPIAVIGPTTAAAVGELGLPEPVVADEASMESLVRAVAVAFTKQRGDDEHGRTG
ncbi:MAG TPA: uroporphyrinogen-III synthase [Longimicrobiales bacterium]|nr:uroporphyrinogen-III synthase [Longimicrobiales bacterium]